MTLTNLLQNLSLRQLVAVLGAFALAMLAAALVAQYGFGLHPCELCMLQRYPYVLLVLVGMVAWFGHGLSARALTLLAWLAVALLVVDSGIATYHAGVELGYFPGPSGCTNQQTGEQTIEQMRAAILNAELVPCDQPMAKPLGLSLAAWNALAAAGVAVVATWLIRKMPHARKA